MRVLQNRNCWFGCGFSGVVLFTVVAAIGATDSSDDWPSRSAAFS